MRSLMSLVRVVSPLILLTLGACGGPPATSPASASAAPPPGPLPPLAAADPAAKEVWSRDLVKGQQVAFMKKKVVPSLAKTFQEHDANRYARFGCTTCHGPSFQDPRHYLPALTQRDGQLTAFVEHPATATFMAERVVPAMAHALGLKPYDPSTHEGFGCSGCHAIVKK